MKPGLLVGSLALGCALRAPGPAAGAAEILETDNSGGSPPVFQSGPADRSAPGDGYVQCLRYLNPRNDADVMAQWAVMDSLFRANRIRIGVTMCSIGCGASIHVDDVARARQILETAIQDRLVDNAILKMEIEVPAIPANAPPGAAAAGP